MKSAEYSPDEHSERLLDDEIATMYREPETITTRQIMSAIVELIERRAADDTLRPADATIQTFRDVDARDLLLAIEMVLREVSSAIERGDFSDRAWPAEVKRVLKLVREFRSNLP